MYDNAVLRPEPGIHLDGGVFSDALEINRVSRNHIRARTVAASFNPDAWLVSAATYP